MTFALGEQYVVDSRDPAGCARRARGGMTITRRLAPIRAPTLMNGPVTVLLIEDAAAVRQQAVHSLGKPFQLPELLGYVSEALGRQAGML
jgi:hypothetical protein